MVTTVQTVFVWAPRVEDVLSFYVDLLGLELVGHWGDWASLRAGPVAVGIHGGRTAPPTSESTTICFGVSDIALAADNLTGAGVAFVRHSTPTGELLDFLDPAGNPIQLKVVP